jgi:predicted Zn-dependent protease
MRVGILLTGAVLLIAACDPVTVPERNGTEVFDFRLPMGADSAVMRWPAASRIAVYVNPAPQAERTTLLAESFTHGATGWEAASLYATYRFALADSPQDADVILTWSDVPVPVVTADCQPSGGAAFTTFCLEGNHLALYPFQNNQPSHVRFIVTVRASEAANRTRVMTLVMHELGHVLGLAQHSPNPGDLMTANPLDRNEPNARDRASVQLLYQLQPDITP